MSSIALSNISTPLSLAQPYVRVIGSGSTLNYTASNNLNFGGTVTDPQSLYNPSTGTITIKNKGVYYVGLSMHNFTDTSVGTPAAITGWCEVRVGNNGTRFGQTNTAQSSINAHTIVPFDKGTVFSVVFVKNLILNNNQLDTYLVVYQLG